MGSILAEGDGLVPTAVVGSVALRGCERGEGRQGPGPIGPGDGHEQHQADPACERYSQFRVVVPP